MERKLRHQTAFYLTGSRNGSKLEPVDGQYRPLLFARFSELSSLRYDFPILLNSNGTPGRAILSLSQLVDDAVDAIGDTDNRDLIARDGYALERAVREELAKIGSGGFAELWKRASTQIDGERDDHVAESARQLWSAFEADGELVDVDRAMPLKTLKHGWNALQLEKAGKFRQKAGRLLQKLRDILRAEEVGSESGRAPEYLKATVGTPFSGAFDFDAMSRILEQSRPAVRLSDERRDRVRKLIGVLEDQRFYPLGSGSAEPYTFAFESCSEALEAYRSRHDEALEFVKTLEVAELEVNGNYRESIHDLIFEDYGANGLDAGALALLPDYLVCVDGDGLDAAETGRIVELLAAGLPFKILVQTDDVLESSPVAEGHIAVGIRSRQLVDTAIGLTDVFVFQASASSLFRMRESLVRGLSHPGPAFFSVFSGANGHSAGVPGYLIAAAANESRVFPSLVYDPFQGEDWAARLTVDDNPGADNDLSVHSFTYEDRSLQACAEDVAFTPADFMVLDERFFRHFAIVPNSGENEALATIPEMLQAEVTEIPDRVPFVSLVDEEGRLHRAIVDQRTFLDVRWYLGMWRRLQELGRKDRPTADGPPRGETGSRIAPESQPETSEAPAVEPVSTAPASSEEAVSTEPVTEEDSGDPYIETPRCTTCNECTEINSEMFAYNEDNQAYIADPDAGTFRQIVEAAEGCQVCIIHPGEPRNPNEPGLDDLIRRAAEFN